MVTDKDKGYKKLVTTILDVGFPGIKVGILEKEGADVYDDATTVLDVAIWNEFGTQDIPARSFIRAWVDADKPAIIRTLQGLLKKVIAKKLEEDQAMEQFGAWCVGRIQQRMARGIPPKNAPSTIRQKGSSVPLIDTGQLRSSVTYEVEKE